MMSSALVSQKELEPDFIIKGILDEYNQQQTHLKKSTTSTTEDAAYSVKDKKSITCENCGKKWHTKEQCQQEGGGKAGKGPKRFKGKKKAEKGGEKAATTASMTMQSSADTEPNDVWLAQAQDDWLTEIAEENVPDLEDLAFDEEEAYMKTYNHALLAGENLGTQEEMILFNSGASQHMSSYHSQFLDYKPIIPKPITAANNHTLHMIGKRDLMISLPLGKGQT